MAPVSYRRIFTGVGIYHRGVQFALVANDCLYFRVDEVSVQPYLDRGMPSLQPEAALSATSGYFQVPPLVLDEPNELLYWMRAAVEAAQKPEDLHAKVENTNSKADSSPASKHFMAG